MKIEDHGDAQSVALSGRSGSIDWLCGLRFSVVCASVSWLAGCAGQQSALDPAGRDAERIAGLFWWMTGGAAIVWVAVVALAIYAIRGPTAENQERRAKLIIIGGGAIVPTVVLAILLVYGLAMLPETIARAPEGSLKIAVTGEQWWWEVRYQSPDREEVVLANEIRIPVGEPVEFELNSRDVIHSFWIPSLGGKMDMFPGRRTRLTLRPTRTGTFRGVCAEYCGTSHALMAFYVVVTEKAEFVRWLDQQRQPAPAPAEPIAVKGREFFFSYGCSACHTIRGTSADGVIGPDLTHAGSRLSVGAGILPSEPQAIQKWIARTDEVKPGVLMPHFGMLPPEELQALAAYLDSLK
jgi:cytochrome c oxidase subunit 2